MSGEKEFTVIFLIAAVAFIIFVIAQPNNAETYTKDEIKEIKTEAYDKGYNKGYEDGKDDPLVDTDAWQEGYDTGYKEGREMGYGAGYNAAMDKAQKNPDLIPQPVE